LRAVQKIGFSRWGKLLFEHVPEAKSLNYPAEARRPEGLLDAGMTKQKS
jgi:hypothetical protein